MRLDEAQRQKERTVGRSLRPAQPMDRLLSQSSVRIRIVWHVGRLVRRAAREQPRLGERYVAEERLFAGQVVRRAARGKRVGDHVGRPVRHTPGCGILVVAVADVEDLAERFRAISLPHGPLRQRHSLGRRAPEVRAEIVDARRSRPQSRQERVARRRADRLIRVGAFEHHTVPGQPIDMRRLRDRVAIRAERRFQIVDENQQNVGPLRRRHGRGPGRHDEERSQHDDDRAERALGQHRLRAVMCYADLTPLAL